MYHGGTMGLHPRRRTPKLWILKLLQVLTNLLLPSAVQRKSISFILCKQILSWGRWRNSITGNVNFVSWRDKKGFIILWKGTQVSGERREKKAPYLYHLQNAEIRWDCGKREETSAVIIACKWMLLSCIDQAETRRHPERIALQKHQSY